ncbi:glycine-rich RNA-binding protein 8 [Morus notabilis]|nr:glycine-rich RNA-binding protein 8 [Morus notabilis]
MRVKFSIQMNPKRRSNSAAMTSPPVKNLIYESPHKLYVGNLAWTVQPQELRDQFSQFGHVTSARVVHDRKAGKTRTYGFLSFASAAERDSAKSLNGKEFCGRIMVVRDGTEKNETSSKL